MNIYGEKVMLRAMEPEDMEMLREIINDPEIEQMVVGWSFPVSRYAQQKWYEQAVNDPNNQRYIIETLDTHEAIGLVTMTNIDWKNRCATTGFKLKKDAPKRKGYATDAMMALSWYAFEQLGLNRTEGSRIVYNEASAGTAEKTGGRVEGVRRQAIYKNGQYYDELYVGRLREDYFEAKARLDWKGHGEE